MKRKMTSTATVILMIAGMISLLFFFGFEKDAAAETVDTATETGLSASQVKDSQSIASFDDLKPYLFLSENRLFLKEGKYTIIHDFAIDTDSEWFSDKTQAVQEGILSFNGNVQIEGGNHHLVVKGQKGIPLFGILKGDDFAVSNLNMDYQGDVTGYAFAKELVSNGKSDGDMTIAGGLIKNITVNVPGSITSEFVTGRAATSRMFNGIFKGTMASGFVWHTSGVSFEGINININGNIGSDTAPENPSYQTAAYGFTHTFDSISSSKYTNVKPWKALHEKGDPSLMRVLGHLEDVHIYVGGSIQAVGHNSGFSAGVAYDMAAIWADQVEITVSRNIQTKLSGTGAAEHKNSSCAVGFADEVMNLTNSRLSACNISLHIDGDGSNVDSLSFVSGIGYSNSHGNYLCLKNNRITVKEKLSASTPNNCIATLGFYNGWNSAGTDGVDWIHIHEDNVYDIGAIELQGTANSTILFAGAAEKWRTGTGALIPSFVLPEASLRNNRISVGEVDIHNPQGRIEASLLMCNISNAKDNDLKYGNIKLRGKKVNYNGMGDLLNKEPKENHYKNTAEGNVLRIGDLIIEAEQNGMVGILSNYQDKEQNLENNTAVAGNVEVTIKGQNTGNTYVGGIVSYARAPIKNCRIFADNITVKQPGTGRLYFGLGAATGNSSITDSSVLVHKNITIEAPQLFAGGFAGWMTDQASISNCHFQLDGNNSIVCENGTYGGFAGYVKGLIEKSSSLLLNDTAPFAGYADGAVFNEIAHYMNQSMPDGRAGLVMNSGTMSKTTLKNSTLLVEKENEEAALYEPENMSDDSKHNYLTVVDNNAADRLNRTAYETGKAEITKNNQTLQIVKKTQKKKGAVQIAGRAFQNRYWNPNVACYVPEKEEFNYVTENQSGGKLSVFGTDRKMITAEGEKGQLVDYYVRHAGILSEHGPVYDLLGIKGQQLFRILYDGNGHDKGEVPIDGMNYTAGSQAVVLGRNTLSKTGYVFTGWNTKASGKGIFYKENDRIIVDEDINLYAQWSEKETKEHTEATGQTETTEHTETTGQTETTEASNATENSSSLSKPEVDPTESKKPDNSQENTDPVNTTESNQSSKVSGIQPEMPTTGDSSHVGLVVFILAGAAAVIVLLLRKRN